LRLVGDDPFGSAAEREIAVYMWTGVLVVALSVVLVLILARHLLHQIRLTRLKNDFIATVTHELKTPLASIRVLVDTLLEGHYEDQHQVREYLMMAAKENERLSRLVDNFLTFSRMERNKQVAGGDEMQLAGVVMDAADSVRERITVAGGVLEVDVDANLPSVVGDHDALVTAVANLLDNARKYARDGVHIRIRGYRDRDQVCLEVQDDGMGIARRHQRKIFRRFYQIDRSLSRGTGGCGLGLSIVKHIVEAHGGTIGLESEPGRGSTFTIRLPAATYGYD
jgi:signal transduction histidine kinase